MIIDPESVPYGRIVLNPQLCVMKEEVLDSIPSFQGKHIVSTLHLSIYDVLQGHRKSWGTTTFTHL